MFVEDIKKDLVVKQTSSKANVYAHNVDYFTLHLENTLMLLDSKNSNENVETWRILRYEYDKEKAFKEKDYPFSLRTIGHLIVRL